MSAFRFDLRDTTLTAALRRIAGSETTAILSLIAAAREMQRKDEGTPCDTTIHGIRKRSKKLRAVLRLLRAGLPKVQPAENALLRDTARSLAHRRDAAVRLAIFDQIAGANDTPETRALRAHLVAETTQAPALPAPDLASLEATFQSLALRIESWDLRGGDRRILAEGLAQTRLRARTAMRNARDRPSDAALHDWRKRAKDVWYHTRLLQPIWPELFKPMEAEADRLGKILGQHHDLAELARHLRALPDDVLRPDLRNSLLPQLTEAQDTLEATAFPLGARLLAGDPQDIADLWVKWWKVWRAQVD